jgi:hypothetical protein
MRSVLGKDLALQYSRPNESSLGSIGEERLTNAYNFELT